MCLRELAVFALAKTLSATGPSGAAPPAAAGAPNVTGGSGPMGATGASAAIETSRNPSSEPETHVYGRAGEGDEETITTQIVPETEIVGFTINGVRAHEGYVPQ